jgi:hypothetical protein
MRNLDSVPSLKTAGVLLAVCSLVLCCIGAAAQGPGPGGPPGFLEKNDKAWEIEAKTVAQGIGIPAEQSKKLVVAYKAARESHIAALREAMGQGVRPEPGKRMEITKAEAAKFETALKGFLKPEGTTTAMASLGTFNTRWDRMVMALDGMSLEEKPKAEAMKLVEQHVVESGKVMQAAAASNDMQSMREKMTPLRDKLDADLAKVLSAEQMTKWKEETAMRRGPGRGAGPGAGGPPPATAPAAPAAPAAPKPAEK